MKYINLAHANLHLKNLSAKELRNLKEPRQKTKQGKEKEKEKKRNLLFYFMGPRMIQQVF